MARSENDAWDVASSVGATATMVAAARAAANRAALIDDAFAAPLVRAVGIDFFTRWANGELDPADVDIPGAPWGMRLITNILAARTRYIDAFFAEASDAGIRQVVLLASGLDARGYRLPWPPGTTVYEIDQPQVVEFKAATLTALGAEPTAALRGVRIDLRHDWPAALQQAGFDPEQATAWSAEGLLMFLPPDAQDHLLDNITALSTDGSRLVAEAFSQSSTIARALADTNQTWYDHGLDVELDNLTYPGERNDVAGYLDERGWYPQRLALRQMLADESLPLPSPDPAWDRAASSPFADSYYCTAVLRSRPPAC